jgi:hypothetical protein
MNEQVRPTLADAEQVPVTRSPLGRLGYKGAVFIRAKEQKVSHQQAGYTYAVYPGREAVMADSKKVQMQ